MALVFFFGDGYRALDTDTDTAKKAETRCDRYMYTIFLYKLWILFIFLFFYFCFLGELNGAARRVEITYFPSLCTSFFAVGCCAAEGLITCIYLI